MKKVLGVIAVSSMALSLAACESVGWSVKASCKGGAGCSAEGEIHGQMKKEVQKGNRKPLLQQMAESGSAFDAAQFAIDVSQSTVSIPNSGLVSIALVDSSTGAVQAATTWGWTKVGAELKLSNPDALNDWAMTHGGTADSLKYALLPFETTAGTFAVSVEYEGAAYATSTASWNGGGGCREVRCHQQ